MIWSIKNKHYAQSDCGYQICWSINPHGGHRFTAWAPTVERGELKVRYGLGESIPQSRPVIGVYDQSEQAKAACEQHWETHNGAAA